MTEPISLSDLRRKSALVPLNGGEFGLQVKGLSAREICDHLDRFPALATLSVGGTLSPMDALKATPGAMAAWIASACGQHNNAGAEAQADENLTAEDQSNLIEESMRLTFSRGFGPFAARLAALMAHLTAPAGRAPDMRSPTRSVPQPPPMSPMNGFGTAPQDSSPPSSSSPSDETMSDRPETSSPPPSAPEAAPTP